jgi:Uma2 family endonuclease
MAQLSTLPSLKRGEWIPMTWEEFLAWPIEGKTEWVDGWGIAYVSNVIPHVRVVRFLEALLDLFVRVFDLGEVFSDNALLRIASRPSGREPDVFVVGREDLGGVQHRWFEGPVLLAIEVLSDDGVGRDLVEKRAEYEQAGVREYLVIDGRSGQRDLTYLRLNATGRYDAVAPDEDGRYRSATLPGFWLDPEWLRQEPLPDIEDLMLAMAPETYEAWILAKLRARRGTAGVP